MRRLFIAIVLLAAGSATTAAAQQGGLSAAHLGASLGVSLPTGGLSSGHAPGFNLAGLAEYQAPGQVMGIRGELFYERFPAKSGASNVKASQAVAGIVNAVYHFQTPAFHPYLIGGMGLYRVTDGGSRPGFNGGVGIQIPLTGMTAFFEARIHKVLTDGSPYVSLPISFGLSF